MSILSNIGSSINKVYTNIDKNVFKGALPGGAEKETKKTTTPTPIPNNPFIPPQQSPLPISTPSTPTTTTTTTTPTTSTSSPSRSSGGSSSSGVVQTPTGGVSTAFPERYTEVYQGIPKYTTPTETNPLGLAPQENKIVSQVLETESNKLNLSKVKGVYDESTGVYYPYSKNQQPISISKEQLPKSSYITPEQYNFYYDEKTGMPRHEVKSAAPTGIATSLQQQKYTNEYYKAFIKYSEPVSLVAQGTAGLITQASPVFGYIGDIGITRKTGSIKQEAYNAAVSYGKQAALFSNPYTGVPTGAYYGAELIKGTTQDPLGFLGGLLTSAKESPGETIGNIAGGSKTIKKAVDISLTKASPNYRPVTNVPQGGRAIENVPSLISSEPITIPIAEKLPKQSIPEQTSLAGTEATLVSGAKDFFGSVINREREIRKPIPGEELLSTETKQMLKQFDEGNLPENKISELNTRIQKESGSKGLLETSFFADPMGRLRPSRLGNKNTDSSTFNLLTEDITFKEPKSQAIVIEKQKIAEFPNTLSDIKEKLSKNEPLTAEQQSRLLTWQLEKTGEFKPIGFLSRESEVTLAPGETLKKKGTLAVTIIDGQKVTINAAEVKKLTGETQQLIKEYKQGKLNEERIKQLEERLNKETGFDYSNQLRNKVYVNPRNISTKYGSPNTSSSESFSLTSYKPSTKSNKESMSLISDSISSPNKSTSSYPISPSPSYPISPSPSYPTSPSQGTSIISYPSYPSYSLDLISPDNIYSDKDSEKNKESLTNQGYDVYGLKNARNNAKRRWIKINDRPLTHEDAQDVGAFAIDNSISATFEIRKSKEPPEQIENALLYGYFADNIQKFRDYKIKKGMKIPLKERYIEKSKDRLDTPGEIKEISLEKIKAEINKGNSSPHSGGMRGYESGFSLTSGDKIEASPNLSRNESKKTPGFSLIGTKNKKATMLKPKSNSFKKNPSLLTTDSLL